MADQPGTMRRSDRPVGAFRVPVSIRFGIVALSLLLSLSQTARAQSGVTQVMIVASMHGLHKTSTAYSYEMLYALVRDFKPDLVGVEIRPEDLGRDQEYLQDNYPKEMIELAQTWGEHAFGFDWLGNDVAGAPIPHDWWTHGSPIKRLERELDQDPDFKSKQLDAIRAQQSDILRSATPSSLNDGRYDRLNDAYYARLQQRLHGTRYAPIAQFYASRDRHRPEHRNTDPCSCRRTHRSGHGGRPSQRRAAQLAPPARFRRDDRPGAVVGGYFECALILGMIGSPEP